MHVISGMGRAESPLLDDLAVDLLPWGMIFSLRVLRDRVAVISSAVALCAPAISPSAALAAAVASPAASAPAAGPISIASGCSYKTMNSGMGFGNLTVNGHGYNFFKVTFTNNATVTADRIVFQIDFGKASRIVIPDVGTFAPGATVNETFRDKGKDMVFSARPVPNDGSVICTVLSAHFKDGTTYTSPLAPAPSASP
jgi:hypothetical protein